MGLFNDREIFDIDKVIKKFADIVFGIEFLGVVSAFLYFLFAGEDAQLGLFEGDNIVLGFAVLIFGTLSILLFYYILYGFAELISQQRSIKSELEKLNEKSSD